MTLTAIQFFQFLLFFFAEGDIPNFLRSHDEFLEKACH
jgi:hypothetical protein